MSVEKKTIMGLFEAQDARFRLETVKKKVTVHCSDESTLSGFFFVSPTAFTHEGSERVEEVLNSDRTYLPFETDVSEIVLLQKGSIAVVSLEDPEMKRDAFLYRRTCAEVHLISGRILRGHVRGDLPHGRARLSDFLNQGRMFFCLEVDGKDCLINSRYVRMVRPLRSEMT
jgi:hypothetical protein